MLGKPLHELSYEFYVIFIKYLISIILFYFILFIADLANEIESKYVVSLASALDVYKKDQLICKSITGCLANLFANNSMHYREYFICFILFVTLR